MRALTAGVVATGLVGLGLFVVLAGRTILSDAGSFSVSADAKGEMFGPPVPADFEPHAAGTPSSASIQTARGIGKDVVAQPEVEPETLVREAARDPLSLLGQALPPPKPEISLFHRPVATASAKFEAMGYKLAIAGAESVDPAETCTHAGVTWPCGIRALTAVRLWLRGRALSCKLPDQTGDEAVVGCRLGKQDVGAWLVANGWARAVPGGPYVQAEAKAREAQMGIFGPAPKAAN